jgi:hypothetical protein
MLAEALFSFNPLATANIKFTAPGFLITVDNTLAII